VITLRRPGAALVALVAAALTVVAVPAAAVGPEVDQAITVQASGNRCLDAAAQYNGQNGTPVQLWDCLGVGQSNQRWYQRWVTPGRFQLVGKASGRCLDAAAQGNGQNGTPVQLWDCYGAGQLNQIWEPVWDTAGSFVVAIRNVGAGRVLDAAGTGNGAGIQLWDNNGLLIQRWRSSFFYTSQPAAGTYNLVYNVATRMCMDVYWFGAGNSGDPLYHYPCDPTGNDNQIFRLEYYDSYRFVIRHNKSPDLCLDPPGPGPVEVPTSLGLYQCLNTPDDNQLWRAELRGARNYFLINDKSGLCLDVSGFRSGDVNSLLGLYHCDENDDHLWQLR
jgi:hypothetical protein